MRHNFKTLGRAYEQGYIVFNEALYMGEWSVKKKVSVT